MIRSWDTGLILEVLIFNPPSTPTQTVAYISALSMHSLISPTCHLSGFRANESSTENAEGGPAEESDIPRYSVTGC